MKVPTIDNPTVMPSALPGVQLQAQDVTAGQRYQAAEMQNAGRDLMQLGNAVQQVTIANNENTAREKANEYLKQQNELLNDSQNGYLNMRGGDAVNKRQNYLDALQATRKAVADSMSNPDQLRLFNNFADQMDASAYNSVNRHAADQTRVYSVDTFKSLAQNFSDAAVNSNDAMTVGDSEYRKNLNGALANIEEAGREEGLPPEAVIHSKQVLTGYVAQQTVARLLASGKPEQAQAYFDMVKSQDLGAMPGADGVRVPLLAPELRSKIEAQLKTSMESTEAVSVVSGLIAKNPNDFQAVATSLQDMYGNDPHKLQIMRSELSTQQAQIEHNDSAVAGHNYGVVLNNILAGRYNTVAQMVSDPNFGALSNSFQHGDDYQAKLREAFTTSQQRAAGKDRMSDPAVYLTLLGGRTDLSKITDPEVYAQWSKLSNSDFEKLVGQVAEARKAKPATSPDYVTLPLLNAAMSAKIKELGVKDKSLQGALMSSAMNAIIAEQQTQNKRFNQDEINASVDTFFRTQATTEHLWGLWHGQDAAYNVTGWGNVPKDERAIFDKLYPNADNDTKLSAWRAAKFKKSLEQ